MRRDASRRLKQNRVLLDLESLETRVPASEQIGTVVTMATLYGGSALLAHMAAPLSPGLSPAARSRESMSLVDPTATVALVPGSEPSPDQPAFVSPGSQAQLVITTEEAIPPRPPEDPILGTSLLANSLPDLADLSPNTAPSRLNHPHAPIGRDAEGHGETPQAGGIPETAPHGAEQQAPSGATPSQETGSASSPSLSPGSTLPTLPSTLPGSSKTSPAGLPAAPTPAGVPGSVASSPQKRSSGHDSSPPTSGGQLWVLDANKAIVVTPGVTQHDFSTWTVDLRAQVSGVTVSSYSWDLSHASDATNISGQSSYRVQFTWASFTGAARTDTITMTTTNVDNSHLTQTLTFLVASTTSPAWTSTPPTSAGTWPTVLPPDALTGQQEAVGNGPYYTLGLNAGDFQTGFTLPSYHPSVAPLSLVYSSAAADPMPIFVTHFQLDPTTAAPPTVKAKLKLNGVTGQVFYYNTASLNPGDIMAIALQGNATGLTTGRYSYDVIVTANYATPIQYDYSGSVDIVNDASSSFGAGWSPANVEQLWPVSGGVLLDEGGGLSLWFANGQISGTFVTPPGDVSTLVQNSDTTYTRTLKDGTKINFSSAGLQTSVVDRNGNTTSFGYNGSNQLVTIVDFNNQVTTLTYNAGGQVTTIVDPANRLTTLTYNASTQMTSLQTPDSAQWSFGYDTSNRMTTLTNPLSKTTSVAYNFAETVATVARPDSTTEQLSALQMQGLVQNGSGTQTNPAPSVLAAQAQASYTDPNTNTWLTNLDWLGFGQATQAQDPLGNMALTYRDANGLPWLASDPLGHRTREFFDSLANPTTIVRADDTTEQYVYNNFSEPTLSIDPLGDRTTGTYDSAGNLLTVQDPLNHLTTNTYTSRGFIATTTDPLNHTTSFGYDSLSRRITTTDPLLDVTTVVYDQAGRTIAVTDARGHTTSFTYDAMNRLLTTQDALNHTTTNIYDAAGNHIATIDALNNRTTYTFDALNRQVQAQDALGNLATTVYDANGNTQVTIDQLGRRTTYTYDTANRQIQVTNALGNLSTTVYDAAGNVIAQVDPLNRRTTFAYDALNRVVQTTDALGGLHTTVYDAAGNTIAKADPLNHRTTYTYDALNRVIQTTDALGNLSTTVYDAAGNTIAEADPLNHRTTFTFDAANRQIQVTDALNDLTTTVYDAAGNAIATVDARGNRTTVTYDALNRAIAQTDPLNHTTSTVYDAVGNVVQTIDALGYPTTFVYDALGRQVSVQNPAGAISTTVYDAVGNVVNSIDPLGNKTTFVYDNLNRRTVTIDARGDLTTVVYDAVGNQVNVIDPDGNKTTMVYDALNREVQQTDPLNHSSTFAYDAAGNLTGTTDRNGNSRVLSYDADNRETGETWIYSGSTVNLLTFTYDPAGNQLTAANAYGTYTMAYDALNRATTTQEPFGLTLTATYDAVSNRVVLQDSLQGLTTSVYDADNELTSRQFGGTNQGTLRIDVGYTARNQIASLTRYSDLGGTQKIGSSAFTYDPDQRLTNLQHSNGSGISLANYTHTYDPADRVTAETLNSNTASYSYDSINELTNDSLHTYSYDAAGNRNMTGYQTGTGNELLSDGTWSYSYDNEGNLIKKTKGTNAETWYFGYDNLNYMTSAKQEATDGGTLLMQATYTYDVYGNRLEQDIWTSSSGMVSTTRFGYDGQNVWVDLNALNGLQTRRLYLDGVDQVFARISSGTAAWYLADEMWSVRDMTDATGAVQDHIDYDGFGNITNETNASFGDRYKWTGREYDSVTGLQYNRARYYAPTVGRWTTQDPIGFDGQDSNLYRYAGNSPTVVVDPSGQFAQRVDPRKNKIRLCEPAKVLKRLRFTLIDSNRMSRDLTRGTLNLSDEKDKTVTVEAQARVWNPNRIAKILVDEYLDSTYTLPGSGRTPHVDGVDHFAQVLDPKEVIAPLLRISFIVRGNTLHTIEFEIISLCPEPNGKDVVLDKKATWRLDKVIWMKDS